MMSIQFMMLVIATIILGDRTANNMILAATTPTIKPVAAPTVKPVIAPTVKPVAVPSVKPSARPSGPTVKPSTFRPSSRCLIVSYCTAVLFELLFSMCYTFSVKDLIEVKS